MGSEEYAGMKEWIDKCRAWNIKALKNGVYKYGIGHRTKWINAGTILVDDKYYFYCQKKIVRIKGTQDKYKVLSFKNFYDQFLR